MPGEGAPTGAMSPSPADHELGPEADVFEREAMAKRSIQASAVNIIERLRPAGEPVKVILDITRDVRMRNGESGLYTALPHGSLLVLSQGAIGANSANPTSAERMSRDVNDLLKADGPAEVKATARRLPIEFSEEGPRALYNGLQFTLLEDPQEIHDPQATDERVVAIEETFARALNGVVAHLEAETTPPYQEPTA